MRPSVPVSAVRAEAFAFPTDGPESDGTLVWDATTMVLATVEGGGVGGFGYSYTHGAAVAVIQQTLAPLIQGADAMDVPRSWRRMVRGIRNLGWNGIAAMAVSAVDCALWDLKARILGLPLCVLMGQVRERIPVYGSGGFTSYDEATLGRQLAGWVDQGITMVKMKVGRDPSADPHRVHAARQAIGTDVGLFVDGNGAYDRKQAVALAQAFAADTVTWFEEPVPSDDLPGLRLIRESVPPGMEITAGEYGFNTPYFARMLASGAIDVLQADATRCMGFSGFLEAGALCAGARTPLSSHCAPALHSHAACSVPALRHMEYFHDHVRIERMVFDGLPDLVGGSLVPHRDAVGHGLSIRRADAEPYRLGV